VKKESLRRRALAAWYARSARPLPWRAGKPDPYRAWLAEIMLQQTRVSQGLPYYHRFLKRFPDVRRLAGASEGEVLKAWEGLGYYSRARNLHAAARHVAAEQAGVFPDTAEGWRALPGVGPYTAAALASTVNGHPACLVDGNVKRVLSRWFAREEEMDSAAGERWCWAMAERLMPPAGLDEPSPGDWNQALMELGALVCLPKNPACGACPVARWCAARAKGAPERYPAKKPKKKPPHVEVAAGALRRGNEVLLGRRPEGGMLAGLWEFPGGKIEPGETPKAALAREWREELGARIIVGARLGAVDHAYSHFTMTLILYACRLRQGSPLPAPLKHIELRWAGPAAWRRLALPAASRRLLEFL